MLKVFLERIVKNNEDVSCVANVNINYNAMMVDALNVLNSMPGNDLYNKDVMKVSEMLSCHWDCFSDVPRNLTFMK